MIFTFIVLGASPILRTLTKDISDDSLFAMTALLFLLHLVFHDYREDQQKVDRYVQINCTDNSHCRFPDPFSINAAIFSSLLLSSRLKSNLDVFFIVVFGICVFGLLPIFRREVLVKNSITIAHNDLPFSLDALFVGSCGQSFSL